jgi:glycosyltransferase involved in cell wall biosynthesis
MALLSILVPTWNRAARLERLLAVLGDEIGARDDVTVTVSDNASDDATPEVLERAAAAMPWLRTHRQSSNVGAAPNMAWLVEHAAGEAEFAWIFGDDDLVAPGRLAEVLDLLARERPAWLFLPYRFVAADGTPGEGVPEPGAAQRFATAGELYRAYHHWLTFVTGSIVRAQPFRAAARELGTASAYAGFLWAFAAAADGPCVVAPHHCVLGSLDISWKDTLDSYLTEHVVDLYDLALGRSMTPEEFAATLDARYLSGDGVWALPMWRTVGMAKLVEAVRRFPHSRALRRYLWALAAEQRERTALTVLDEAVRVAGVEPVARGHVAAGEDAFGAGDAFRAEQEFRAAADAMPTLPEAWNDLAVVRFQRGAFDALAAVDNAVFVAPDDVEARLNRAQILAARGDRAGAAEDARRVLELEAGNEAARELLASLGA